MLLTPPPSPINGQCLDDNDRIGQLLLNRIQLTSILGEGAYGTVYKAIDIHTGTYYAVKSLTKRGLDARQRSFQQHEIQLHHEVSSHPNVVSVLDILDYEGCTFVILEFCSAGDLFTNITEKGQYSGNDLLIRHAFLQILDAVEHCHFNGIYHRDLKPENILVSDSGMTVKLADFGLATKDVYSCDFGCGSTFYMSPECQDPAPRPFSCYASGPNDVWSLGVILVNLVCGRNPWKRASLDDPTFSAFLRNPWSLGSILPISLEVNHILQQVFDLDPSKRPSIPSLRTAIMQCEAFSTRSLQSSQPSRAVHLANPKVIIPTTTPFDSHLSQTHSPTYDDYQLYAYPESYTSSSPAISYAPSSTATAYATPAATAPSSPLSTCFPTPSYLHIPSIPRQPSPPSMPQQSYLPRQQPSASPFLAVPFQSWYANLMPALDLAQKHMRFCPVLPGVGFG